MKEELITELCKKIETLLEISAKNSVLITRQFIAMRKRIKVIELRLDKLEANKEEIKP